MKPKYTMLQIVHLAMQEKGFEHYNRLAEHLGVTKGTVSAWIQSEGFHKPHLETRIKLAEAAKVTVKDIDQAVAYQKIKHMRRKLELMQEQITMIVAAFFVVVLTTFPKEAKAEKFDITQLVTNQANRLSFYTLYSLLIRFRLWLVRFMARPLLTNAWS